jgi:predicted transcriptional regulator
MCYAVRMTAKLLTEAMKRVEAWPEAAQEELAGIALEIDAVLNGGAYCPTQEELAGVDRGLRAAELGRFAAPDDVLAVFAKHRPA